MPISEFEYKRKAFKYFLFKLNRAYRTTEAQEGRKMYSLSYVKIMKFLFFASTLNKNDLIRDKLFDNWYALPKGPVEDFCYGELKRTELKTEADAFGLNFELRLIEGVPEQDETLNAIDESIKLIYEKGLLLEDEDTLVEISHRWNCWRNAFLRANLVGKNSAPIDSSEIHSEPVYI